MAHRSSITFILVTSAILLVTAQLQPENYRLPELYTPSSYHIELSLTSEVFTGSSNEFSGRVAIRFTFTNSTNYIALHSQPDYITINRITCNNIDIPISNYSVNTVTEILRIDLGSQINVGIPYDLIIEYTGVISITDMYGIYRSSYVNANGTTKYLLANLFEPTYARRAFPCFDEPALKATFDFTITLPTGLNTLFNTQQSRSIVNAATGLTTVIFNTTPRMSTYLVALTVSEFTCTYGASIGTVPYQVCSRNESAATRDLALEYGPKLLAALNNFTNYSYSVGIAKLDQVAVPDFAAGAMEHWGLITYREDALLYDVNESSNHNQQRVITVIAHELAHQWFGNLVTLKWWSEIFMNEGFATYFEYHITHEVLPTWELDKQFVIQELHAALRSDALENARALQSATSVPAEISSNFDITSYSKGGSILRMVEHFMQLENFREGIQNYVTQYQFENAEPADLWPALNGSVVASVSNLPTNLSAVMKNWVTQPGFPLLTVKLNGNEVTVSQERFLLTDGSNETKWYIPVTYTTSLDSDKFQNTTPNAWLTPSDDLHITLPINFDWIILNNQQTGYYRVNYENDLWEKIRIALLRGNFDGITELNRAQIVDDLFNLARANRINYASTLDIIGFLRHDTSYYSWYAAYNGFNFLLRRVGETSVLGHEIALNILDLMGDLYLSVPISTLKEDDQIYTFRQVLAQSWACRLGGDDCITSARTSFNLYKLSGQRPNRNLRSITYCYGLKYSTDSSDWYFLWDAYVNSAGLATEQSTILSALGCTTNETLLKEYLNKSITDESGIRPQDTLTVFSSVYTGSSTGVDAAFEFLMENYEDIAARYKSMNSLGNLIKGIAERFTNEEQINRLRNFTESESLTENILVAANEALEIAEANLRWLEQFEDDLNGYYRISGAEKIFVSSITLILSFICLVVAK